MSQQGTGQREANQTKDAEYVTSEGRPRNLVFLWGVLQIGLPYSPIKVAIFGILGLTAIGSES